MSQIRHGRLSTLTVIVEVWQKRRDGITLVDITWAYIEERSSWAALAEQELVTQLPQTVDVVTGRNLELRVKVRRLIFHVFNSFSGAGIPAQLLSHIYRLRFGCFYTNKRNVELSFPKGRGCGRSCYPLDWL